ncbi:hypothetical protein HMI55_000283 [Coelomomyces lativittatus]|nr:hypothetical protein HMI55_000283 [Coelomomyces lativittatus]
MNTEQVISTLETAQASAPAMDSQILSMKSVENTKTMGTAAKSFSIPLPHKIEDETKMTNNLSHNFPETLREASRSAESPPLHEQEKLEKQESLSEIDKNTNLETTVVTEKNLGELHDVEDFKRQSTIALDQVSGELQSVSEPVMLQDNRKVEQETKDAPINLKEVNMERSVMHDETTVTLKEIEPKESIEMADVSFEVKGRTPARRTSTKKMHSNAKNPPNFVYETNIPAGSIVFAQLKGFPKWPAMVLEPTDIPEVHLPKKLGMNLYCVMFYGSYQYGFPRDRDVIPFSPNVENVLSVAPKKLQIQAIKEAQTNPMIIYEKNKEYLENQKYLATSNELQDEETVMVSGGGGGRRRNAHEEEEDDDEEEVGEEDEEYHEVTPKRNNRRHPPLSSSLPKHRDVDTKKNTSRHSSPTTSSTNITTTTTTTTTTTPSQKKRRLSALPSEEVTPTSKRIKHVRSIDGPPLQTIHDLTTDPH